MATRGQPDHPNRGNGAVRPAMSATGRSHGDPTIEDADVSTPIYERVVRAEEIAPMFDCSTKTVLRMAKAGQIPAVQIGKLWRFRKSAINAWLDARLQTTGTSLAGKLECASHPRVAQETKN